MMSNNNTRFPIQPMKDKRFIPNRIVEALLNTSAFDLNKIAIMDFTNEERTQLAMLIGYSLGGFADLSYVDGESYYEAERLSEGLGNWIKMDDFMPELGKTIDLYGSGRRLTGFRYMKALNCFRSLSTQMNHDVSKFTHWMYEPEPPKKKREG